MLPIWNIGPLAIQIPGLILLAGIWIGLSRIEWFARHRKMRVEVISGLVFYTLLAGILGARLGYIAQNIGVFIQRPIDVLSLSPQMLDTSGGIIAMLLTGFVYGQRKGMALWPTLDVLTPGLAVLIMALAGMNLSSGNGFGVPARLPWSIYLFEDWRHPTQIYDLILGFAIWRVIESKPHDVSLPDGSRFLTLVALAAAAHIAVDAFRAENVMIGLGGVRSTQLIAFSILLVAVEMIRRRKTSQKEAEP
ncbi:MAG: diacylglyceryl transferase [Bellilinea sp.]|nr:MAG: diacylglyceryl transferase [Bellilinea sp.]